MSYTALYRKWRPTSFEEVRGQDHIVKTLKNQINSGRIGHAYLFCGTRGTGKTSIAKIFARAVNCEHPVDGSPCGECSMCLQIAEGASLNVVEIDAGDTYAYDTEGLKTQKARENAAKERIYSLLPDDQKEKLVEIFDEFEERKTPEAKFARALDNLQPLLLNNSNDGGDWKRHDVTAKQVYGRQSRTREGSEKLFEITDQILKENIAKGNIKE